MTLSRWELDLASSSQVTSLASRQVDFCTFAVKSGVECTLIGAIAGHSWQTDHFFPTPGSSFLVFDDGLGCLDSDSSLRWGTW